MAATQSTHVSVVVPIYNMQRYLAETLDAILASDYEHFEVILMDDGSSDRSWDIAQSYAQKDPRIKAYRQENGGASSARNHAIRLAQGPYILPVDADNNITKNYIREAATYLDTHPEVKVVSCEVEYCGDKSGRMHFVDFSINRLARKNMIDNCAMYRKSDWEACGGYAEHIKGREDWAFWISMFKDGGEFYRLPILGFYYRVHANSKRIATQKRKHLLIEALNELHPEFYEEQLGGPLHEHRSWSKLLNVCYRLWHPRKWKTAKNYQHLEYFVKSLPRQFQYQKGEVIYQGRNELRRFDIAGKSYVVKSFQKPNIVNRIAYGFLRKSKAERSYDYAEKLLSLGIATPQPVAYYQERCGLLFSKSYYVCLASEKTIHFKDIDSLNDEERTCFLQAVGKLTARLHEAGIYHKDYSGGNILLSFTQKAGKLQAELELLDLNRMRFGQVSLEKGCANFDRFHVDEDSIACMARAYARARDFDEERCISKALQFHRANHPKA